MTATPSAEAELRARLRAAIPPEPALTGLAGLVETGARRRRRRRRLGVVVAAAVAVAAIVGVTRLAGAPPTPTPTGPATPAACVPEHRLDHPDFRTGTAAWVLACPSPWPAADLPLPSLVLRRGAAAFVRSWQDRASPAATGVLCPTRDVPEPTVQVGFTDGTVARVTVGACAAAVTGRNLSFDASGRAFADAFARAVHREYEPRISSLVGYGARCPADLGDPAAMNSSQRSARALTPDGALLNLAAESGVACRYDHGRLTRSYRDLDPERLLLASSSGWYLRGRGGGNWPAGRAARPPQLDPSTDFLVSLRDHTGTWRTFTVTGRYGAVTLYRSGGSPDVVGWAGRPMYAALGYR